MFLVEYVRLLVCIQVTLSVTIDYRTTIQPYGFNMCGTICQRVVGCKSFLYQASELRCQCETSSLNSPSGRFRTRYSVTQMEHGLVGCLEGSVVIQTKYNEFYCFECINNQIKQHTHIESPQTPPMDRDVCKKFLNYVTRGNIKTIKEIVKQHKGHKMCKNVLMKQNALMIVANKGHKTIFDFLRTQGYSLEEYDGIGNTALHNAVLSCSIFMVKHILSLGDLGVDSLGFNGYTPLMLTVISCTTNMDLFHFLVQKGAKLNSDTSSGFNMLHAAVCAGNINAIKYILDKTSIKVDQQQRYGMTSYMYAHLIGQKKVEEFLISKKCNTSLTPVPRSMRRDLEERFQYVARKVVDTFAQNHNNQAFKTPFIIAALDHNVEVFQFLQFRKACNSTEIGIGASTNLRHGCRKLEFKWLPIIKRFRISIIDFRMSDNTECFMTAVKSRRQSVVKLIRSYGGVVK